MNRKEFVTGMSFGLVWVAISTSGFSIKEIINKNIKDNKESNSELEAILEKYDNWTNYALTKSYEENVILVNKSQYTLDILREGRKINQFFVELGKDPINDKLMEGDMCTPEGVYLTKNKKQFDATKYYKAIILNYPTQENRDNFYEKKTAKIIPSYATIGGGIEIHGHGSGKKGNDALHKGRNWTYGCIALSNNDMDLVFEKIDINTPIIIVGYTSVEYK
jgi:murein L,D-transpeptidase YafK